MNDVKPYTLGEFPIRANAEQIRLHHDDDCMAPVGRDCTCHVAADREMIRRLYETALVGLRAAAVERGVRETSELPDIEVVSARVHEEWMEAKRRAGVTSRKLESGEELMVPYSDLSEQAKSLDRVTVRTVYRAIEEVSAARSGYDAPKSGTVPGGENG